MRPSETNGSHQEPSSDHLLVRRRKNPPQNLFFFVFLKAKLIKESKWHNWLSLKTAHSQIDTNKCILYVKSVKIQCLVIKGPCNRKMLHKRLFTDPLSCINIFKPDFKFPFFIPSNTKIDVKSMPLPLDMFDYVDRCVRFRYSRKCVVQAGLDLNWKLLISRRCKSILAGLGCARV